ncbi:MAG TPA: methyl-accepting chemotaxis protein [Bacillota bacterium]|nr:methyl-accepting chemotaxis protein [Bacillota bacterium]
MRLTIAKKFVGLFLIIVILLGITGRYSYTVTKGMESNYDSLLNREANLRYYATAIEANVSGLTSSLRGYLLTKDKADLDAYKQATERVNKFIESSMALAGREDQKELLKKLSELNEYYQKEANFVFPLVDSDLEEAKRLATTMVFPTGKEMIGISNQLVDNQVKMMADLQQANKQYIEKTNKILASMNITSIILTVLLGLWLSRKIAISIVEISKATKLIAEGDLTGKDIDIKSKDEIQDLADYFNIMKNNLDDLLRHVAISVDHVASSSEELVASAEQTSKATEQITLAAQEVSVGSERQSQSAKETRGIVDEISKGMGQVATSIQSVADATIHANEVTTQGNEVVSQTVNQMEKIQQKTQAAADVVDSLGVKSKEIGQIVTIITEIAAQTNLLALNAAIEAARAGEHGKGFAVVAEEVRKLAEQSGSAAKKISHLIQQIQDETQNAVMAMLDGNQAVDEGMAQVKQTGGTFENISKIIEGVSAQSQEVSAIVEKVNASSQMMVEMIESVAAVSEQAVGNSQSMATSSEEQLASMEEVTASASSLAHLAEQLQLQIQKFKF